MIEVTFALVAVLLAIWLTWRWHHTTMFYRNGIPGPKPSLIFGNMIELYKKGPLKCHEEWVKQYGNVLGYYYGMKQILLVADPQLLKNIYIKDFSKFVDREPFNPLTHPVQKDEINQSVLILKGQKWKEVRSVLTPTFSTAKMKQMAITMNSSIDVMLGNMGERAQKGEVFDIHDSFQRLTMDVISKTAFGVLLDIQKNEKSRLLQATKLLFSTPYKDYVLFLGLVFPIFRRLAVEIQSLMVKILNRGITPVNMLRAGLKQVLAHRKANKDKRKPDLLQLMIDTKISLDSTDVDVQKLEAGKPDEERTEDRASEERVSKVIRHMTDKEIIASSTTVFLAGYETTSTALAFTTYLLAKHQDVQQRVFEEIQELVQSGEKLEYGTINKLPYLDKVLNESLRIYPPVYLFTNRYALEDVKYGDLKIPEGVIIQAPTYLLHHDPEYWTDPETFNPDRFETKPNTNGITFLPFGIGPRNCMGMRFAQMEAKLALAHLIHKFQVHLAQEQMETLPISLMMRTLKPTNGVKVKIEIRDKETAL